MDLNSLSKEQLIALLEKKSEKVNNDEMLKSQGIPPSSENTVEICQFRPIKGNQPPCNLESSTPYGFCKKHSRTVQARRAEKAWEETHKAQEQNQEPPEPEPVPEPVPIPEPEQKPEQTQTAKTVPSRVPMPVPERQPFRENTSVDKLAEQLGNMEKRILQKAQHAEKKSKEKSSKHAPATSKTRTSSAYQTTQKSAPNKKMHKSSHSSTKKAPVKEKSKVQARPPQPKTKKIKPNIWGRYEDLDTHILFDPTTKQAIGVQNRNGTVSALGKKHISICKKLGWKYRVPKGYNYDDSDNEKEQESSDEETESDEDNEDSEPSITDDELSDKYLDSDSDEESKDDSDEESEEEESEEESDEDDYEEDDDYEDDYSDGSDDYY
jgi:hypothetical protein